MKSLALPARLALFLLATAVITGCAALPGATDVAAQLNPQQAYTVEIRRPDKTPLEKQFALEGPLFLQDVLEQTGVVRKFRKMDIQIQRVTPHSPSPIKMDVAYYRKTRGVADQMNYAIHPGDRIVITEDDSSMLDDMLESVFDSLGPLQQR